MYSQSMILYYYIIAPSYHNNQYLQGGGLGCKSDVLKGSPIQEVATQPISPTLAAARALAILLCSSTESSYKLATYQLGWTP